MTESSAQTPAATTSDGSTPPADEALLVPADVRQKLEHVGPSWATSVQVDESVVWWHYECETQVEAEDFEHPDAPPMTVIVRLERADGVEHTFVPAVAGVPAAVETTIEQGRELVVLDPVALGEKVLPEMYLTLQQAESLGRALAEAVTVYRDRTRDAE